MTIEYTATNRNDYTGNGIATTYSFTFKVLKQINTAKNKNYTIKVIISENNVKTELIEDVDYTVALESNGFGTITFTTAPTSTQQIVFLNEILRTQEADYINIGSGKFPADSHEKALDKLTLICKEQDEAIGRAILLDETSNLSNITLPINTSNADKALVINSSGDNLAAKNLADIGLAPVTDFAKTLLDDVSNIEARTTLDVYSKSEVYNKSESDNLITEATTTTQGISYLDKPITIANNATDADHDIDFGAGNFNFDDGSGQAVATALTKQIDAAWAEGDNVGGLDTGTVAADTIYYCFAIWNPTTSTSDFLFSASLLNPILPSGYTKKKRIGALAANGGANIYQGVWSDKNRQFKFDVNISTINTNSPPTSRTNVLAPAPPNSLLKFDATYTANINNVAPFYILVTNPNQTDTAPDAENNTLVYVDNFAGYVANTVIDEVRVDDNRNIAYRASNGIANNFRLNSRGWFENNLF